MAFDLPKLSYSGQIKEITLGEGDKAITVGGETSYPFHLFDFYCVAFFLQHCVRRVVFCTLIAENFFGGPVVPCSIRYAAKRRSYEFFKRLSLRGYYI